MTKVLSICYRIIFVLLFILFSLSGLHAQNLEKEFQYVDAKGNPSKGKLEFIFEKASFTEDSYVLDIAVSWFDKNNALIDRDRAPYLYLSKYMRVQVQPQDKVTCTNLNPSSVREFHMRNNDLLVFEVDPYYTGNIRISLKFAYYFDKDQLSRGILYDLKIPGNAEGAILLSFPVEASREEEVTNPTDDPNTENIIVKTAAELALEKEYNQLLADFDQLIKELRDTKISAQYTYLIDRMETIDVEDLAAKNTFSREIRSRQNQARNLVHKVQEFNARCTAFRDKVDPTDFGEVKSNTGELITNVQNLENEYNEYRVDIGSLLNRPFFRTAEIPVLSGEIEDTISSWLSDLYLPGMQRYYNDLNQLASSFTELGYRIDNEFVRVIDDKEKRKDSIDQYQLEIEQLTLDYQGMKYLADSIFNDYDNNADTVFIPEIVNLKTDFFELYSTLNDNLGSAKRKFKELDSYQIEKTKINPVYYWLGGGALFILLLIFGFTRKEKTVIVEKGKELSPNEKLQSELDKSIEIAGKGGALIDEDLIQEYSKLVFDDQKTKSGIGRIHFHHLAIKKIYQLINKYLTEKMSESRSGYFVGRYYKIPGDELNRYELFVDGFYSSEIIHSPEDYEVEFSTEVLDEINRVLEKNKGSVLLGWMHTRPGQALVLTGAGQRINKTFFREKYQFSMIIDPFSEGFDTCILPKNISGNGYIDQMDLDTHKFEDMYHKLYAKEDRESDIPNFDKKDFRSIGINEKWCDSIVNTISFSKESLESLKYIEDNSTQSLRIERMAGYFYGYVEEHENFMGAQKNVEYELYVDRLVEAKDNAFPRDIPGLKLLGWFGFADMEIFDQLRVALSFHERIFNENYQFMLLLNTQSTEVRVFSRKHNLELNNNVIETNEYSLSDLL